MKIGDTVLITDGANRIIGTITDQPEADPKSIRVSPRDPSEGAFWAQTSQVQKVWEK